MKNVKPTVTKWNSHIFRLFPAVKQLKSCNSSYFCDSVQKRSSIHLFFNPIGERQSIVMLLSWIDIFIFQWAHLQNNIIYIFNISVTGEVTSSVWDHVQFSFVPKKVAYTEVLNWIYHFSLISASVFFLSSLTIFWYAGHWILLGRSIWNSKVPFYCFQYSYRVWLSISSDWNRLPKTVFVLVPQLNTVWRKEGCGDGLRSFNRPIRIRSADRYLK